MKQEKIKGKYLTMANSQANEGIFNAKKDTTPKAKPVKKEKRGK